MKVKIEKCSACPLMTTNKKNPECRADDSIKIEDSAVVHDDCPLRDHSLELEYAGEKNVMTPTAFLFHAKNPNFGMEDICFTPGNFEVTATIFKKNVTPDWIFENTQNIDDSWAQRVWPKKEKIVSTQPNMRSTSVGDIVLIPNRFASGTHLVLRCDNTGWKPVDTLEYLCTGCKEESFGTNWPSLKEHFFFAGCKCE